MPRIEANETEPGVFEVSVTSGGSTTTHRVTADSDTVAHLAPDRSPRHVVEASFRFLLDREPKESILRSFDLPVIARYFPDYEARLGDYLEDDG